MAIACAIWPEKHYEMSDKGNLSLPMCCNAVITIFSSTFEMYFCTMILINSLKYNEYRTYLRFLRCVRNAAKTVRSCNYLLTSPKQRIPGAWNYLRRVLYYRLIIDFDFPHSLHINKWITVPYLTLTDPMGRPHVCEEVSWEALRSIFKSLVWPARKMP